jgi:hypothetical protein
MSTLRTAAHEAGLLEAFHLLGHGRVRRPDRLRERPNGRLTPRVREQFADEPVLRNRPEDRQQGDRSSRRHVHILNDIVEEVNTSTAGTTRFRELVSTRTRRSLVIGNHGGATLPLHECFAVYEVVAELSRRQLDGLVEVAVTELGHDPQ